MPVPNWRWPRRNLGGHPGRRSSILSHHRRDAPNWQTIEADVI